MAVKALKLSRVPAAASSPKIFVAELNGRQGIETHREIIRHEADANAVAELNGRQGIETRARASISPQSRRRARPVAELNGRQGIETRIDMPRLDSDPDESQS